MLSVEFVEEYIDKQVDKKTIREECWSEYNIPTKVFKAQFANGNLIFEKQNDKICRHLLVRVYAEEKDNGKACVEQAKLREKWKKEGAYFGD